MKKYYSITLFVSLFLMLLLLLSICGCRDNVKKIDYSDKYVFGQDSQENCIALQGCAVTAESRKSYYYLCEDNKFIYVVDKTRKKCMPLCNKTNCLHDKEATPEDCNAFLGVTADNIIFYNDYLYYSSSKEYTDKDGVLHTVNEINSIALDGSSKTNVFSTEEYTIWSFKIHRGFMYADMTLIGSEGNSEGKNSSLYKISIEDTSKITQFLPYKEYSKIKGFLVLDTRFYGNNLILLFNKLDNNNGEERILINYDLQTDKWINLSEKLKVNVTSFFTVCKDNIYYGAKNKVYKCDFQGNNQSCIIDGGDSEFSEFKDYTYFNPLTNDGENVIINVANDDGISRDVIFYNCDNDKTEIHKLKGANQADSGGDEKSLIYKADNSLYFYDKMEKKTYTIYDFES